MSSLLQNKLSVYEADPPDRVWEAISASLDHQIPGTYPTRLLEYEVAPPSGVWAKIQSRLIQLEKIDPAVIPFYRKYRTHLKYSGVAAFIITFGIISSLLISKKTKSEIPSGEVVQQVQTTPKSLKNPESFSQNTHLISASGNYMRPEILQERISRQLHSATGNTMALLEKVAPKFAERKQSINFSIPIDTYMIYSDEHGNAVRLPKKLFDAFACPDDKIPCRQQLKKLQEKIASSSVTSDLTSMLEMLNNLPENQ